MIAQGGRRERQRLSFLPWTVGVGQGRGDGAGKRSGSRGAAPCLLEVEGWGLRTQRPWGAPGPMSGALLLGAAGRKACCQAPLFSCSDGARLVYPEGETFTLLTR